MSDDVENPKVGSGANQKGSEASSPVNEIQPTWYSGLLHQTSIYGIAAGYCVSASLLSIINKWAVMKFPYPGALTALQYFTSAAGVFVCGWFRLVEHDPLDLLIMWRFLPAAIMFYLSLFTNSELLLHANVDTFIVFRSVVPIFVAIGETMFLHQPWPALKTWLSLATIFGGSLNTWGLVLYNNLEALLLFPLELLIMGELKKIKREISDESDWYSFEVVLPVGLSCLFGLSISFFGFSCRKAISATGYTVLGVVNKLLTVVINLVIWDKHSSFIGTIGLLICMLGGIMYQQSTSKPKSVPEVKAEETEEEEQKLLEMQSKMESNNNEKEVTESHQGK
ncbi:hypothetical protein GH714_017492 [Hevea brasiliensis]|uniref:Sugar phosphate transporter domain-containing protein n=1 Tax=Hevea brasiliensis TaxID=3981 RepID=A0A6A6KF46_HEVBR|nr:hypothetical protein GH714_017492 [Hevea brasiliensis]